MNKALRAVLVLAFTFGGLQAAKDKKTELVMRDHRHSAAAFTILHELSMKKENEDQFESKVAANVFYNESQSRASLGKTFAANNTNSVTVGHVLTYPAETAVASPKDVNNNYLLHFASDPTNNTLAGTVIFNPKETTFGSRIDMCLMLDKWVKGLYFKSNWAVMNVKHDLGVTYSDAHTGADSNESFSLENILNGSPVPRTSGGAANLRDEQLALTHAKIAGSHSETGLGDIESCLGWKFLDEKDYYVSANIAWRIPTAYAPDGEFLWYPRLGSKHWALGAGVTGGVTLWEDEDQTLKLKGEINYKYLFEESEKRTFGLKDTTTWSPETKHIFSQYYLLGEAGKFELIPAANVLTRDADVTPGSQVDAFIDLNYNNGGLAFDLGYNLFWKESESVKMKETWNDARYGFPKAGCALSSTDPFTLSDTDECYKAITSSQIDKSVAETPSILSHTIFGGLGYIFKDWENPLMLGIGGSYEFGNDHVAADSFTIWGKIGFAF